MITDIEDYFTLGCGRCERFATPDCSTRRWIDGLNALRRICSDAGLVETVKWAHPCYMHAERNIAIIGAFRGDYRLSFFNAALLKDPEGVLERQGPNSLHPDMIRFTDTRQVEAMEPVIRAYLREAMAYAQAGIRPEVEERDIDMPDELIDALDSDPELAEAFHALTPGRKKSYLFNLNAAKASSTRVARIEKFRDRIIAGKGALER
ncbi:MAG: YdeI/OmpD-associated family protein [Devosia nanyangense]|uniref:YdeI/OmpD-associated family protein n=1 Tax=Devosia nanyangense TaxID=1228055 RepID=A0A933KYV8_9HYPH|nr:YdeI/OmpD-associated family protein [Devosia nanyangense]